MSRKLRPSPSMIVALAAVFIALGGGAYAVSTAPRNSVKSSSIKNGQVKKADLASRAVTKSKLGADVNAAFVPKSSVRRINFSPTDCDNPGDGCYGVVQLGGLELDLICGNFLWPHALQVDVAPVGVQVDSNYSYVVNDNSTEVGTAHVHGQSGSGEVFHLLPGASIANAAGVLVLTRPGEEITIPFHAYVGPGLSPPNVACVFEGTATRS